jgi:hypothetical protein
MPGTRKIADRRLARHLYGRRKIVSRVTLLPAVAWHLDSSYSEQLAAADTSVKRR